MTFTSLYETRAMSVGAVGSLCVGRWRSLPMPEEMRAMHDALVPWVAQTGPFVALNMVDIRAMIVVPDDVRAEMARVQHSFDGTQLGLATIVPERGFFAAAVRAVVGAVQLMSRAHYPQKVFGTIGDSAAWANVVLRNAGRPPVAVIEVDAAFVALNADAAASPGRRAGHAA